MSQETRPETTTPPDKCKNDPATQPPAPTTPDTCKPLVVEGKDPCYTDAPKCVPCCECPSPPTDKPGCLEDLIKKEAESINKGEQAKKFKSELEALLGKVKAATLEYTADSYKDLVERWKKEDDAIVCLIRSIHCALPCWWCVIECELCPLVNDIVRLESKLSGDFRKCGEQKPATVATTTTTTTTTTTPVPPTDPCFTSLYDYRHAWWREKLRRQSLFDHIAGIMKAWETPFKTIDGVLKANAEILKAAAGTLGIDQKKDAAKLLFDVFFKLIPQHMAIAPPVGAGPDKVVTNIEKKYVDLCCCDDTPEIHNCCGVIIRLPTVRDRLLGAFPYLIAPDKYADLICCLATKVYQPAKQRAVDADSKWSEADTEVKAVEAGIPALLASLPADAKVKLGKTIDCSTSYKAGTGTDGKKHKCCGDDEPAPPSDGGKKPGCDDPKPGGGSPGQTNNPAQTEGASQTNSPAQNSNPAQSGGLAQSSGSSAA